MRVKTRDEGKGWEWEREMRARDESGCEYTLILRFSNWNIETILTIYVSKMFSLIFLLFGIFTFRHYNISTFVFFGIYVFYIFTFDIFSFAIFSFDIFSFDIFCFDIFASTFLLSALLGGIWPLARERNKSNTFNIHRDYSLYLFLSLSFSSCLFIQWILSQ